jgi:hypothetical protein
LQVRPTHVHANATSHPQPSCCSVVACLDEATSQGWAAALTSAHGAWRCAVTKTTATPTSAPAVSTPTLATCTRRSHTRRRGEE